MNFLPSGHLFQDYKLGEGSDGKETCDKALRLVCHQTWDLQIRGVVEIHRQGKFEMTPGQSLDMILIFSVFL